jgi:hypothetical protein
MALVPSDWSIDATGLITYVGDPHGGASPSYATVLELHRWLQDLADDESATGDDLVDIVKSTPSERSTDNIITLLPPFRIDDTAAEHLYDGSITQDNGDTVYSGLVVVGSTTPGTQLQIIQNNTIITNFWGTGLNADPANNILLRILVKTRTGGADIDGKRLRVQARELGSSYAEFSLTAGLGNSTAAVFTSVDLNNQTSEATIASWSDITFTEGYQGLDVNGDGSDEFYYVKWSKGTRSINDLYERVKWIQRRGSATTIFGMNGELFRGVTHEIPYDTQGAGQVFAQNEIVTFGNGATAAVLADTEAGVDGGTTGKLYVQLLTGVAPSDNDTITGGTSGATALVNGSPITRTVAPVALGTSTGSAIIGAYGVGIDPADLTASDQLFDLDNNLVVPPNNVTFTVNNLVPGEDRVLVTNENAGDIDFGQLTLTSTLSGGETSITVNEVIPTDTPTSGTIRVFDGTTYVRVTYTGYNGSTFTGCSNTPAASAGANVFISYIDKLATSTSESFTVVYNSPRTLFIRVRDGGATPIKTFQTTGTLGSSGGSTTVIRTSDL